MLQKSADGQFPLMELGWVAVQQDKVVHITDIESDLELVFDKAVQLVKVKIRKKLGRQRADGHADVRRCMKKAFVPWNLPQQMRGAAILGIVGGVLGQDFFDDVCEKNPLTSIDLGDAAKMAQHNLLKFVAVDAGEIGGNITFHSVGRRWESAHKRLESVGGAMGAFLGAVRKAIKNKALV